LTELNPIRPMEPGYHEVAESDFNTMHPARGSGFIYDSVIAMFMGATHALRETRRLQMRYPNTGTDSRFYNSLVNVNFTGATGEVVLNDKKYYTRDDKTMTFGVYNIRPKGENDANGINTQKKIELEYVLTAIKKPSRGWEEVEGEEFIFPDGTTNEVMPLHTIVDPLRKYKVVLITLFSICLILIFAVIKVRNRKAFWRVELDELIFDEPPTIIGMGSFGIVLLGEYRGTLVAVKKAIPPSDKLRDSVRDDRDTQPLEEIELKDLKDCKIECEDEDNMSVTDLSKKVDVVNMFKRESSIGKYKRRILDAANADFLKEINNLSMLRHPHIVTVMGAVIQRGENPLLVMEYMVHGSLYDFIHNSTIVLDGDIILPIICDIVQGILFLHSAKPPCIHGDLKSKNILVNKDLRAKVADFGQRGKRRMKHFGSPFWMAPELLRKETTPNVKTDAYAFGIILYEVYSRQDPPEGEDIGEFIKMIKDPNSPKQPLKACPSVVRNIIIECLSTNPESRPTFAELHRRLSQLDSETVQPTKPVCQSRRQSTIINSESSKELLFQVFPRHIAKTLCEGRKVEAEIIDEVTIFFSDIVGFTDISSTLTPVKISQMLDRLYNAFDALSDEYNVFKVETIGDAYMAVTNLVDDQQMDHAVRVAHFSIKALEAANQTLIDSDDPNRGYINIRVGFHSGPVVANVVGSRNPRYCLFGDTVNTASRMESNSQKNRIHCSEAAALLIRKQSLEMPLQSRGKIEVKGKGLMRTFWVNEGNRSRREFLPASTNPEKVGRVSLVLSAGESTRSSLEWAKSSAGGSASRLFQTGTQKRRIKEESSSSLSC